MINNVFQLAVEIFSYNATSNKKKQKQKTKNKKNNKSAGLWNGIAIQFQKMCFKNQHNQRY